MWKGGGEHKKLHYRRRYSNKRWCINIRNIIKWGELTADGSRGIDV
jgi:hypothetical protein